MSKGYPSDWDSRRKAVYKRDNYTCQNCNAKGGSRGHAELHAHHIVPKGSGGTHKKSNLKTLCKDCHNAIHGDSMAPSTDTKDTFEEFPLDVDNHASSVSTHIECINKVVSIVEKVDLLCDELNNLQRYNKMVNSDVTIPDKIEEKHPEIKREVDSINISLRKEIDELKSFSESNFSSKISENIDDFCGTTKEFLQLTEEFVKSIYEKEEDEGAYIQFISEIMEEISNETEIVISSLKKEMVEIDDITGYRYTQDYTAEEWREKRVNEMIVEGIKLTPFIFLWMLICAVLGLIIDATLAFIFSVLIVVVVRREYNKRKE